MKTENIYNLKDNTEGKWETYIVWLLMAIVALLSILFFSNQSLRLDEAQSLWQSSRNFAGMFQLVAGDVHVPFYHILLHLWQFFFGNGVVTARLLSLIFFIASIPAVYYLGKYVYGSRVGLFAAVLVSVSPFLNWYGNEIRMYSLFMLLTIINQHAFLRIYRNEAASGWWILFGLTTILGAFTHYFFFLVLLSEVTFYLIFFRNFPVKALGGFILVTSVLIAFMIPWLWYVYTLGQALNSSPLLNTPTTINLFSTFSQFLFGFQDDHINAILLSLWPLSVLLGLLAVREGTVVSRVTIFFLISLFMPVVVVFAASFAVRPIYLTRYLILTVPSLYIFIGWLLSRYPRALNYSLKGFLIATMLFTLGTEALQADVPVKENYREASVYLASHASPQDIIIVSAPFTVYPIEYYYKGFTPLSTIPVWDRYTHGPIPSFSEKDLPAEATALTKDHEIAWLVLSYDQGYEDKVRLYFDTHFARISSQQFSHDLTIYAYKLRYYSPNLQDILKEFKSGASGGSNIGNNGGSNSPIASSSTSTP